MTKQWENKKKSSVSGIYKRVCVRNKEDFEEVGCFLLLGSSGGVFASLVVFDEALPRAQVHSTHWAASSGSLGLAGLRHFVFLPTVFAVACVSSWHLVREVAPDVVCRDRLCA